MKEICGEVKEILYDKKINKLNLQLARDKNNSPVIIFQDWTKDRVRNLFTLHIKEAVEMKAIIDNLIIEHLEGEDE